MAQFTGTQAVSARHAFDVTALERHLQTGLPGFAGPLTRRAVQGRPVQSDLQADHAATHLRDARQAGPGVQAAAVGARDRARVPRHARARRHRACRCRRCTCCATTRAVIGRAFYVMQFVDGRVLWEQSLPGFEPSRTRRHLRRDEPRDRRAAQRRSPRARAWPTTASRATTSNARSARWSKQYQMSVTAADPRDGPPDRMAARAPAGQRRSTNRRCRSCTATSGSTT